MATVDSDGKVISKKTRSAFSYPEDLGGGIKLEMVAIPPGQFLMGSAEGEAPYKDEERQQHRVTISYWFYLGKFEVRQAEWRAVMGMNPSNFADCDECPVEKVSWNDAVEFCKRLSTKREYRLPTEAEWEYAARAGTTTPFGFGETITPEIANYNGNYPYGKAAKGVYRRRTTAVGSLSGANRFGLFDMHGNVWEWCQDWYHCNYSGAPTDGSAWLSGAHEPSRVYRGGEWDLGANAARSAFRGWGPAGDRKKSYGFRVVMTAGIE